MWEYFNNFNNNLGKNFVKYCSMLGLFDKNLKYLL